MQHYLPNTVPVLKCFRLPPCAVCWGGMQEDQGSSGCLPDRGWPGGPHVAGSGL